jgi:hypothetical protein
MLKTSGVWILRRESRLFAILCKKARHKVSPLETNDCLLLARKRHFKLHQMARILTKKTRKVDF